MSTYPEYSLDNEIAEFFTKMSSTRKACDSKAKELVGGEVVPVAVQGNCSYSVYAGPEFEFVVQFRLKSLMLKPEIAALAREVYGSLARIISFHRQLGDSGTKEPLLTYVASRVQGISHLDFVLANGFPENSSQNFVWRKVLMTGIARYDSPSIFVIWTDLIISDVYSLQKLLTYHSFFAHSWKCPLRLSRESTPSIHQGPTAIAPLSTTSFSSGYTGVP